MTLREQLGRRHLVLDGAMGTMIQTYALAESDYRGGRNDLGRVLQRGNNDLLCLTRPDIVADIHRRYVAAGADIVTTNTFNAQRISLADYCCEHLVRDINLAAAKLARQSGAAFVAGSVGPTNKTLSMSPNVDDPAYRALGFDAMAAAYQEQMEALIEGGVDALLIETCFDTLNAKAALWAAEEAMDAVGRRVELMVSATIAGPSGRLLSGQTLDAFVVSVSHAPLLSLGLNCSFGARDLLQHVRRLSEISSFYISAHPNAGLPNAMGAYDETPESMAADIEAFLPYVNIVGGCCGSTDSHIRLISQAVRGSSFEPPVPQSRSCSTLAGLDALAWPDFLKVGERCNVAGSRKFLRLIKEKKYDEAIAIAAAQIKAGAHVIDVNLDDALLDTKEEMCHFLRLMGSEPEVARVPVMIDSSRWDVISAALRCLQGKSIVNSISLKEGETPFLGHARELRRMGAAVVVMAFDEQGQATTAERRIEVCARAYRLLTERLGFPPSDIIFDPNVLSVATGMEEHDDYAASFLHAVGWMHSNLPGAHISGGISNLSFSFRGNDYIRQAMHSVFIAEGRRLGMDMAIVNSSTLFPPEHIPMLERWVVEDVILNRFSGAADRLVELAGQISSRQAVLKTGDSQTVPPSHVKAGSNHQPKEGGGSLVQCLVDGSTACLDDFIQQALVATPRAIDIIQGPLMEGMAEVGRQFAAGKMFLPQVVKSARVMKQAVAILQPLIEQQKEASPLRHRKALLATVKGDVHDIGKNIVSVVMACNGYDIIDLGVMVPAEQIVEAALMHKPDVIGLSGLITPSLDEMINVVARLAEAGIEAPVMIGGATTSELHTAMKIAPAYNGPVLWVPDASQNVPLVQAVIDGGEPARAALHERQISLCATANGTTHDVLAIDEARNRALKLF